MVQKQIVLTYYPYDLWAYMLFKTKSRWFANKVKPILMIISFSYGKTTNVDRESNYLLIFSLPMFVFLNWGI